MLHRVVMIIAAAGVLWTAPAIAQEASPAACEGAIGRHTPTGVEFEGLESTVSEPFPIRDGLLLAEVAMSDAGSVELVNAAGESILLGNGSEAYEAIEATTVRSPGDYYLVVDFYSASEGEWSVKLEQPTS